MNGRVVAMGAAQAARAALTALIPITLITLFGWASSGYGNGDSGDAFRGAGVVWLASHHVLFGLKVATSQVVGQFWFLPIGLLLVPYLTLHGSGLRLARELRGQKVRVLLLASISLSIIYAVLVTVVAVLIRTTSVKANPVIAFLMGFLAAIFFGVPRILSLNLPGSARALWAAVYSGLKILLILGAASVLASLVINVEEVVNITKVLRLGLISGTFILLLSLLYLPNLAVWALAYFTGVGFGFGTGSSVSIFGTDIGSVPAFPFLAAIPAEPPRGSTYLPLLVLIAFAIVGFQRFRVLEFVEALLPAAKVALLVVPASMGLAFLSGGSMFGGDLSSVGPSLWKFPLVIALESFIGVVAGSSIRVLLDRARPRQRLRRV